MNAPASCSFPLFLRAAAYMSRQDKSEPRRCLMFANTTAFRSILRDTQAVRCWSAAALRQRSYSLAARQRTANTESTNAHPCRDWSRGSTLPAIAAGWSRGRRSRASTTADSSAGFTLAATPRPQSGIAWHATQSQPKSSQSRVARSAIFCMKRIQVQMEQPPRANGLLYTPKLWGEYGVINQGIAGI